MFIVGKQTWCTNSGDSLWLDMALSINCCLKSITGVGAIAFIKKQAEPPDSKYRCPGMGIGSV